MVANDVAGRQGRPCRTSGLPSSPAALRGRVEALLAKGLSVPEAARALGRPERTVRYHAARVRAGVAGRGLPKTAPPPPTGNGREWYRPHDFTLSLPIHWASDGYRAKLAKGGSNYARFRGHFVQFSKATVVVRGAPGFGFEGSDHEDAMRRAQPYWEQLVRRMEARWGLVLFKDDGEFRMTYETGEVGNELAGEFRKHGVVVRIRDQASGTVWATWDFSPKKIGAGDVGEMDAVDALTAGEDMQRVLTPYMNSLRDNVNALRLPAESWRMHDALAEQTLALTRELRALSSQVAALVEVQKLHTETVLADRRDVQQPDSVVDDYVRPWYIQ